MYLGSQYSQLVVVGQLGGTCAISQPWNTPLAVGESHDHGRLWQVAVCILMNKIQIQFLQWYDCYLKRAQLAARTALG